MGEDRETAQARSMTLGAQLRRRANIDPAQVAYRFGDQQRTFGEIDERVDQLVGALLQRGVSMGDRVATMMQNSIEHIEILWATVRLGAIFVPVNVRLAPGEVAYILDNSGAAVVFVDDAADAVPAQTLAAAGRTVITAGSPYEEMLASADTVAAPSYPLVGEQDPALIIYTSGTTGRPKGAVLSHFNLLINTYTKVITHGVTGVDEVWLSALPMCHIAGVSSLFPCLLLGGTCVVMRSGDFDAATLVDTLEREDVTSCFLVPTQWQAVAAITDVGRRTPALRQIAWGGSIAPRSTLEAMAAAFPHAATFNTFGQTEMSPLTCVLRGEDALRKMGSVGRPVPNVEVRIVDDEMNDVPDGDVGEIVYRGPTMLQEYWADPAETERAFAGGWFHSGDLVRRDEEGFIYVVDRKKDMIISGGEDIYSAEVEGVIIRHPGVSDVALVGVPHPRWVETPVAVIVPTDPQHPPTLAEIADWCRAHLASFKKPMAIRIVDALPRNASGKVLKTNLRDDIAAG